MQVTVRSPDRTHWACRIPECATVDVGFTLVANDTATGKTAVFHRHSAGTYKFTAVDIQCALVIDNIETCTATANSGRTVNTLEVGTDKLTTVEVHLCGQLICVIMLAVTVNIHIVQTHIVANGNTTCKLTLGGFCCAECTAVEIDFCTGIAIEDRCGAGSCICVNATGFVGRAIADIEVAVGLKCTGINCQLIAIEAQIHSCTGRNTDTTAHGVVAIQVVIAAAQCVAFTGGCHLAGGLAIYIIAVVGKLVSVQRHIRNCLAAGMEFAIRMLAATFTVGMSGRNRNIHCTQNGITLLNGQSSSTLCGSLDH